MRHQDHSVALHLGKGHDHKMPQYSERNMQGTTAVLNQARAMLQTPHHVRSCLGMSDRRAPADIAAQYRHVRRLSIERTETSGLRTN